MKKASFSLKSVTNKNLKENISLLIKWFGKMKVTDYIELSKEAKKNNFNLTINVEGE